MSHTPHVRVVPSVAKEKEQPRRMGAMDIMLTARQMAVEMSNSIGNTNAQYRADPANRERLELLATDAAQRILQERLSRLLGRGAWTREDLLDLSSLFFLLALPE